MFQVSSVVALFLTGSLVAAASAATFPVKDFGAAADGVTDDTAAFQKALQRAAEVKGSTVFAPAGRYLIAGSLEIPAHTTLSGEYRGPGRQRGTVLLSKFGKGRADGPGCIVATAGGCGVRGICIEYPDQSAEAAEPVPFPYAIQAGPDARIEEIFLYNAYQGINLDGAHASLVRNIWGEPLKTGIHADHIYDICRIENVHFWPYFTLNRPLRGWVQANGVAFEFGRSDWQYTFNTFCYGYRVGYRFFASKEVKEKAYPGGLTNGNFVGIGADCVGVALDIQDSFNIGISITNGEFAPFGGTNCYGVLLHDGNSGNITLVNCNFWAVAETLAEVRGGSLSLVGCNIHEWNASKKENWPAIRVTNGRLNVTGCTFNSGGLLAELQGLSTRASFTNNMGSATLRVISRIGDRGVFSANNPPFVVVKE